MVSNKIKSQRAEAGITAASLAAQMPDEINKVGMSIIESGKALPTRCNLQKICEVLNCDPTDLYDVEDLDLLAVGRGDDDPADLYPKAPEPMEMTVSVDRSGGTPKIRIAVESSSDNAGQEDVKEQFRVWMPAREKQALWAVVKGLGYSSLAEWFREMCRNTLERYITMNLVGNIHENIPTTTTKIKLPEVVDQS